MHKRSRILRALAVDGLCIAAGFLAAIAAINLLPGSLDLVTAAGSLPHAVQGNSSAPAFVVNRVRKGDRLDLPRANGIGLSENAGRDSIEPGPVPDAKKRSPVSPRIVGCEPLASPLVDPLLARLAGRCMALRSSPPDLGPSGLTDVDTEARSRSRTAAEPPRA